jgi:hypothetical protein
VRVIDTITGEDVIVAAHGSEAVSITVRCPQFGGISQVRLSHDQVAALAGALTGIVLEHGTWRLAGDS